MPRKMISTTDTEVFIFEIKGELKMVMDLNGKAEGIIFREGNNEMKVRKIK